MSQNLTAVNETSWNLRNCQGKPLSEQPVSFKLYVWGCTILVDVAGLESLIIRIMLIAHKDFKGIYCVNSKLNADSSLYIASLLRELKCHMGSLSVTCHQAEVRFPPLLLQPIEAGIGN